MSSSVLMLILKYLSDHNILSIILISTRQSGYNERNYTLTVRLQNFNDMFEEADIINNVLKNYSEKIVYMVFL